MKCGSTPSLSHHAESRVSPPAPREPNGAPLSKADRLRQAVSLEGAGEHGLRALDRRRGNARLDQKPGVAVGDRQRIDAALVARAEPALEIGGPLLVGRLGRDHPPRQIERRPPAPDLLDEARPVQDVADGRGRRPLRRAVAALQDRQQLARAKNAETLAARQEAPPPCPKACDADRCAARANDP